jgi:hypothetical protein
VGGVVGSEDDVVTPVLDRPDLAGEGAGEMDEADPQGGYRVRL